MNPSPLTFLTEKEFNESLTPNRLNFGRDIVNDKCTSHFENLHDIEQLKGIRKHCLLTLNHFKKRFYIEWLNTLWERHINQHRLIKKGACVLIGDAVLATDSIKSMVMWQKECITDYVKGRDCEVRGLKLLTINSQIDRVELNRPLRLLSLEIVNKKFSKNNVGTIQRHDVNTLYKNLKDDSAVTRKRRAAARNTDIIRRLTDNWKVLQLRIVTRRECGE